MNICVFGASSTKIDDTYIAAAFDLGAEIARRGHTLYFGGGTRGLMGASARGASSQGGRIIGVSIDLFDVDGVLYDKCTEMILTDTLADRKKIMYKSSDAFVTVPGGIGTIDELFEVLTIRQLGLTSKPVMILNTNGFYDKMLSFIEASVNEGFVKKEMAELFETFDDPRELLDRLEERCASPVQKRYKD